MQQLKKIVRNIIFDAEYMKMLGQALPERADQLAEKYKDCLFVPPVREGDTVFAVLDALFENEEPLIEEWKVAGVALIKGKWYVYDATGERFEFDSEYAYPDREKAERALEVLKNEHKTRSATAKEDLC